MKSLFICLSSCAVFSLLLLVMPFHVLRSDALADSLTSGSSTLDNGSHPGVYLVPDVTIKWVVGERFEADVSVENVSGMSGIYFELSWDGFYDSRVSSYSQVLNTSTRDIAVSETLLPKPYKVYSLSLTTGAEKSWLKFLCVPDCTTTSPQNGTGKIMSINFTVLDPWSGGRQPVYKQGDCSWAPSNATTEVSIWWGYMMSRYPSTHYVYFGDFYGNTSGNQCYAVCGNMEFTFMPTPGDLDGNGIVDAEDLAIIVQFYNQSASEYPVAYYDFDRNGVIDVYDVVVVARNYGRSSPF
jgi:hypothetical protein